MVFLSQVRCISREYVCMISLFQVRCIGRECVGKVCLFQARCIYRELVGKKTYKCLLLSFLVDLNLLLRLFDDSTYIDLGDWR